MRRVRFGRGSRDEGGESETAIQTDGDQRSLGDHRLIGCLELISGAGVMGDAVLQHDIFATNAKKDICTEGSYSRNRSWEK